MSTDNFYTKKQGRCSPASTDKSKLMKCALVLTPCTTTAGRGRRGNISSPLHRLDSSAQNEPIPSQNVSPPWGPRRETPSDTRPVGRRVRRRIFYYKAGGLLAVRNGRASSRQVPLPCNPLLTGLPTRFIRRKRRSASTPRAP